MTTFSGQVATGIDDAHETDAGASFANNAVTMRCEASTTSSSRWNCAFRIDNVTVPAGATITNAYASVVFPVVQRDSPDLDWYGNNVDDANDFDTEGDVTSRTLTTATVAWNGTDLGYGSFVDSPDLTTIIEEIIARGGWASGQAMVMIAKGQNTTAQENGCRFTPYDNVTADACKLTIEYSTDITGTLAVTLGDDTLAATGELDIEGTLAETLGDDTLAATGELDIEGALAVTLGDDTLAATGELDIEGTLAVTLGSDTLVATGISAGIIPVTLNGYLFSVAWDSYDQPRQKSQEVGFGLTGKMLIQNFPFVDYRWTMDLLVWETETRIGYGDLDDLRIAYALDTFDYIDLEGNSHTVVMQGELPSKNLEPSDVYKIPVSLREYQT